MRSSLDTRRILARCYNGHATGWICPACGPRCINAWGRLRASRGRNLIRRGQSSHRQDTSLGHWTTGFKQNHLWASAAPSNQTKLLPSRSITASARASRLQWFRHRATCAQTNSRAPSIVLNQFDDLWSPSASRRARDRRSSCRILACHLVVHAKLHLSCGAHPH